MKGKSFSLANIESKEYDISIFNDILFSFLYILSLQFYILFISQSNQIIIFHYLSANETFFEISVNSSSSLRSFCKFADSPTSNFISSRSKEVNKVQSLISSFNNFWQHSPFFIFFINFCCLPGTSSA